MIQNSIQYREIYSKIKDKLTTDHRRWERADTMTRLYLLVKNSSRALSIDEIAHELEKSQKRTDEMIDISILDDIGIQREDGIKIMEHRRIPAGKKITKYRWLPKEYKELFVRYRQTPLVFYYSEEVQIERLKDPHAFRAFLMKFIDIKISNTDKQIGVYTRYKEKLLGLKEKL